MGIRSYTIRKIQSLSFRKGKINRIRFDSNHCITELCEIGARFNTDKSPLNTYSQEVINARHAYTPIYDFLFAPLRYKEINLAEFGIHKGAGMRTFREYFEKAHLYGFDYEEESLQLNKELNLAKTEIDFIDVRSEDGIHQALRKVDVLFDIIIDDSSHNLEDQIRVITCCPPYLKTGGILVIEDIYDDYRSHERHFEKALKEVTDRYCFSSFFYPRNKNTDVGNWNNEKLLIMIRN